MPLALAVIRKMEPDHSRSLVRFQVLFQPTEPIWKDQPDPFSRNFDPDKIGYIWEVDSLPDLSEEHLLNNKVTMGEEYVAMVFPLNLSPEMVDMLEAVSGFSEFFQGRVESPADFLDPLNKMAKMGNSSFVAEFPEVLTFMLQLAMYVPKVIPAGAAELAMYPLEAVEMYRSKKVSVS